MRRKLHRKDKKQKKIIISLSIFLVLLLSAGYAAFTTNIVLRAKGNIQGKLLLNTYINDLYNDGDGTLINDGTVEQNIRYSGKEVNNYVCIENEKKCSEDNLYRIIGVFNNVKTSLSSNDETRIKIIRANFVLPTAYDVDNDVNWDKPVSLNTFLNSSFLASNRFIDDAVWYLGSCWIGITSSESYKCERETTSIWTGKVALIYQSDYGFASKACYESKKMWDSAGNDYSLDVCRNDNWMFNGSTEWSLVKSSYMNRINFIGGSGSVIDNDDGYPNTTTNYYRPSFYLKSDIYILNNGNDGSLDKPYILTTK